MTRTPRFQRTRPSRPRLLGVAVLCAAALGATSPGSVEAAPRGAGLPAARVHDGTVELPVTGGTALVRTATLAVLARTGSGNVLTLSGAAAIPLGRPGSVVLRGASATWSLPARNLLVTAASVRGRLQITVHDDTDGATLPWPVTGTDRSAAQLQLPLGEGLGIPVADTFWNAPGNGLAGTSYGLETDLSMPLWGYTLAGHGVSYLVPQPIDTSLAMASDGGRLLATSVHTFSHREATEDYQVDFSLTAPAPTAPALDYRSWLAQHGQLVTLRQKIAANPAVARLLGAFHAYLWGSARTTQGVQQMQALGLTRMWLGYDADGDPMTPQAVTAAEKAGYLVGPYDSWANGQDPATADSPTATWPGQVYPGFCVHQQDGTVLSGFHGQGCYLSSQAFAQQPQYLAQRTRQMTANGADSYFLDVDAAGQLYDDYTPGHQMNQSQDEADRLARMRRLSGPDHLVLGSEAAHSWASPVIDFSHGSQTPAADGLWPLENDRSVWGGYYPATAPKFFFQPVTLPAALTTAMFDPVYRVPLLETALHDVQVNLDRWELSYTKFPALETDRALLAMLDDTPLNLVLDGPTLTAQGKQLAALQRYFAPLQEAAGTQPMTDFRYLTPDHQVQRTEFGDGVLRVTANFGTKAYGSLPGGCVDAQLAGDRSPRRLCPSTIG